MNSVFNFIFSYFLEFLQIFIEFFLKRGHFFAKKIQNWIKYLSKKLFNVSDEENKNIFLLRSNIFGFFAKLKILKKKKNSEKIPFYKLKIDVDCSWKLWARFWKIPCDFEQVDEFLSFDGWRLFVIFKYENFSFLFSQKRNDSPTNQKEFNRCRGKCLFCLFELLNCFCKTKLKKMEHEHAVLESNSKTALQSKVSSYLKQSPTITYHFWR